MLAKVSTSCISGIDATPVEVEVQTRRGTPRFTIIGLGDGAIRESRDRVVTALVQSGFAPPQQILVNLAPAELKKEGASFDLAIAIGILVSTGRVQSEKLSSMHVHGELSLDGRLKPVRGIVARAILANACVDEILVPLENQEEASLISGVKVVGLASLVEVAAYLCGAFCPQMAPEVRRALAEPVAGPVKRLSEVRGQELGKRAMAIAAAGAHNLLFLGPPGCGKSMLAERFTRLLPPMRGTELLEAVKIHSVAGLPIAKLIRGERPFRSPHHTVSEAGLVGGGPTPRPGEISLAHQGALFLDEFPEFRRASLEAMRGPLESGSVQVTRARATIVFPARFQLLAAMNPCPCGRLGVPGLRCTCSASMIQGYLAKLSQPILDRIDLHVELEPVPLKTVFSPGAHPRPCDEDALAIQIASARAAQDECFGRPSALLTGDELLKRNGPTPSALSLLERAAQKVGLSARGCIRVLRVARTIADLGDGGRIQEEHIAEAVGFRSLERLRRICGNEPRSEATQKNPAQPSRS